MTRAINPVAASRYLTHRVTAIPIDLTPQSQELSASAIVERPLRHNNCKCVSSTVGDATRLKGRSASRHTATLWHCLASSPMPLICFRLACHISRVSKLCFQNLRDLGCSSCQIARFAQFSLIGLITCRHSCRFSRSHLDQLSSTFQRL